MIRRIVMSGAAARQLLAEGAKELADAVKSTLGPYGQTWFIDKKNTITNDGVTVAREIIFQDEVKNRGAIALKEAATKTVDSVGDGTTTSIVLAQEIYQTVSKYLAKEGVLGKKTPAELIKQIEKEREEVDAKLVAMATPIETKEQLIDSATVATGDRDLGTLIGETQWELGKEGYLRAEETAERKSYAERVHGLRIDNGFGTSQIINDQEKQELRVEETAVILTTHTIRTMQDWLKLIKVISIAAQNGAKSVVVVARAWTDETIALCLQNTNIAEQGGVPDEKGRIKGFRIYPLNAPYTDMQERMKDLSAVVGARFFDSEDSDLSDIMLSDLGVADKVIGRRFEADIIGKKSDGAQKRIDARVAELEERMKGEQSDFMKKNLAERISQLKNGFGVIKVGSHSDMERRRLFDKAEDAVHAIRAAFQEGTVKGGGLAFKEIAVGMPNDALLKRALMTPYEQIMYSAPQGFVIEDWVRDPVKVLRIALQNACTAASSFATAGGVVTQQNPSRLDEIFGQK